LTGTFINLDGKTIRHSGSDKALHIVRAWCQTNQLTLAQEKVDDKSNEITALPKLLKLLDLKGRIVTIDAMGAQCDICKQIVEQSIKSLMRKCPLNILWQMSTKFFMPRPCGVILLY